jgi:hypothetical protein
MGPDMHYFDSPARRSTGGQPQRRNGVGLHDVKPLVTPRLFANLNLLDGFRRSNGHSAAAEIAKAAGRNASSILSIECKAQAMRQFRLQRARSQTAVEGSKAKEQRR